MLRLQTGLPADVLRRLAPTSSRDRIAAAKAALGERLFILGHHYQRDEVMPLGRCPRRQLRAAPCSPSNAPTPST